MKQICFAVWIPFRLTDPFDPTCTQLRPVDLLLVVHSTAKANNSFVVNRGTPEIYVCNNYSNPTHHRIYREKVFASLKSKWELKQDNMRKR